MLPSQILKSHPVVQEYAKTQDHLTHFLTYADNNAVGYFAKQGFTKEITLDKECVSPSHCICYTACNVAMSCLISPDRVSPAVLQHHLQACSFMRVPSVCLMHSFTLLTSFSSFCCCTSCCPGCSAAPYAVYSANSLHMHKFGDHRPYLLYLSAHHSMLMDSTDRQSVFCASHSGCTVAQEQHNTQGKQVTKRFMPTIYLCYSSHVALTRCVSPAVGRIHQGL